jgi:putative N6-adenine-specific DNA methylase
MSAPDPEGLRVRVPPGLEPIAAAELAERGIPAVETAGGITMPLVHLEDVLLWSRVGSAVTRRMGTVRAEKLPDGLRSLPWKHVIRRGQRVEVRAIGLRNRGIEKKCAAVVARMADPRQARGARVPPARILLIARGGRVEVALVAANDLWKRGWRKNPGRAPLRENLAAGLLAAAEWSPDEWLVDPMCGSGTFAIEAAHRAIGRAPGGFRTFAAEFWPSFDTRSFDRKRKQARAAIGGTVRVWASDRSGSQLRACRANAETARVARQIQMQQVAFEDLEPPAETGLLISNPPYGQRLAASESTFRFIGQQLADVWPGWRYGVLLPDASLVRCLPGRPRSSIMVDNGGRKVWLAVGVVPGGNPGSAS